MGRNVSVVVGKCCERIVFAVSFFVVKPLCKNMLLLKNVWKTAFCPSSVKNLSVARPSLAAYICTAFDALSTWRTCSVAASRSRRGSVSAKIKAKMSADRFCIFVLSPPNFCCDEAVSFSTTHFRDSFALSEKILDFSSSPFCLKSL